MRPWIRPRWRWVQTVALVWLLGGGGIPRIALAADPAAAAVAWLRDDAALAALAAGKTNLADASWWGVDSDDATAALQGAIDSGAPRVRVPFIGRPWVVRPITLRGNLELEFAAGVVVEAKPGEFRGGGDSLFRAVDVTNLVVRGYGATLRMRKRDYQNPPYSKAEWRMGLSLTGCRDVRIEGLRIESTGGDGLYVGSSARNRWCEQVVLRDCVCHDNHRQGLSVISAVNLLVEGCTFSATAGTPPAAGIDLEPDEPDERLVNCVIRDCRVLDNSGNGILVWLKPLTARSEPVSIRFENCHVAMTPSAPSPLPATDPGDHGWSGFVVGEVRDDGPGGLIEFVRCTSSDTGREAVRLVNKSARGARVRFVECYWRSPWQARHRDYGGPRVPVLVVRRGNETCRDPGGVEFVQCRVDNDTDAPALRFEDDEPSGAIREVVGTLICTNPKGRRAWLGPAPRDSSLQVVGGVEK